MKRTTVSLEDPMLVELHQIAEARGISIAALIREALEQKLASHRPLPRSLGSGASGHGDTSRRSGDERPAPRPWR